MAVDTSSFRNGLKIELDGEPYTITYFQHVKPGKGGAFVRTKVKSLKSGKVVDKRFRAGPHGMDEVQFLISANVGEAPRPLSRIASGGEISRIMLALKQIIAELDQVSVLVFDEIDAGISGKVAAAVARRLEVLARSHQVITITHLPQIASKLPWCSSYPSNTPYQCHRQTPLPSRDPNPTL